MVEMGPPNPGGQPVRAQKQADPATKKDQAPNEYAVPTEDLTLPVVLHLRDLRAEVQDLKAVLDDVRAGKALIQSYADYIQKTQYDMAVLMQNIHGRDDNIRHVRNLWEQISACPLIRDPKGACEPKDLLMYLDALAGQIDKMVFLIGVLTIPNRVQKWVDGARPGHSIPFHLVFADEIPSEEQRMLLLRLLAFSRLVQGAIIDPDTGFVYCFNTNFWWRLVNMLVAAAAVVVTFGIVRLSVVVPYPNWPLHLADLGALLIGWAALLIGVLIHIAIARQKRGQQKGGQSPTFAARDLSVLVDAHLSAILQKLLLALVGFFGLVFASGIANVSVLNCFLVGYSLDSVIELFATTLDQQGAAQVASLKKELGVS